MVPTKKEELRNLVTQTTLETYEELTPHLVQLINETNRNPELTEAQMQWNVNMNLAFGAKGIQYFPMIQPNPETYPQFAGNALIDVSGKKTVWYDYAKENGITLTGEFYGMEETLTGKEIGLWRK